LANFSIFFQFLAIENVVDFQIFPFEIVLDVENFSIEESS
jgi:hypothetical protein